MFANYVVMNRKRKTNPKEIQKYSRTVYCPLNRIYALSQWNSPCLIMTSMSKRCSNLFAFVFLINFVSKSRLIKSLSFYLTIRPRGRIDRKSTRLNSSHANISYAVFCLKKKKNNKKKKKKTNKKNKKKEKQKKKKLKQKNNKRK